MALWQTRRQERYGLSIQGRILVTRKTNNPSKWESLVEFVATNTGRRPITIAEARMEFKSADGMMIGVMRTDKNPPRVTLAPGEQVLVAWDRDEIEQTRMGMNGGPLPIASLLILWETYTRPHTPAGRCRERTGA